MAGGEYGFRVPRKTPLSPIELEIGRRIRDARIASGFSGVELARRLGIGANRLSSYENGQNPVPYWIADKIADETDHCQRWLFDGSLPKTPHLHVDAALINALPKRALFSEVYSALLRKHVDEFMRDVSKVSSRPIEELEGNDFHGWAPLYAPRIRQLQAVAITSIRRAEYLVRTMNGDQLTDFQEAFGKLLSSWERLVHKSKGRVLQSAIEESKERTEVTEFLRERWTLFEKRRNRNA